VKCILKQNRVRTKHINIHCDSFDIPNEIQNYENNSVASFISFQMLC